MPELAVTSNTYLELSPDVLLLEDKLLRMDMINKTIKN